MFLLEVVAFLVGGILLLITLLLGYGFVACAIDARPRRRPEPGFEYVYVEEDGSVRELDAVEREKLDISDPKRPYIKSRSEPMNDPEAFRLRSVLETDYIKPRYEPEYPSSQMSGYLRRRQVPENIPIELQRRTDIGFAFIYVEEDGSARELDAAEREFLSRKYHPCDGGRPYIKSHYEARTPANHLAGLLRRRQLPKHVSIRPMPDHKP